MNSDENKQINKQTKKTRRRLLKKVRADLPSENKQESLTIETKPSRKYWFLCVPQNSVESIAKKEQVFFSLKALHVKIGVGLLLCICLIMIGIAAFFTARSEAQKETINSLSAEVELLKSDKETLKTQNSELLGKNAVMSHSISEMTKREEDRKKEEESAKIPSGLPLTGKAVIMQESELTSDEEGKSANEPKVCFSAQPGVKVIATAMGEVVYVEEDPYYGYCVTIGHENNYVSIYRTMSNPRVAVGDKVDKGEVLFEILLEDQVIVYQVKQDGKFVDPIKFMDVSG